MPSTEHLLHDLAWLNSLATTLARDRDDGDDLAQEALIAAWQRQPDPTRPMRGWFTKVVRDLAGMKRRSDQRRAVRNALAHDTQAPAAPDELLAQVRLHQRLVELVLALDEPYRSTIIARFVEGRTSASIAKSLGIPDGTVRKRLHEALSRLRAGLDANEGKHWAPAVLAFAQGGVYVAKPTKFMIGIVAALLLATATTAITVRSLRRGDDEPSSTTSSQIASSTRQTPPSVPGTSPDARAASPTVSKRRADLLEAITRAREARTRRGADPAAITTAPSGTRSGGNESAATVLDITDRSGDTSEWSKRALGTLNTLLGQCYDLGLAEDSKLAGDIMLRFTLVGEPKVGGLLERVEIVDTNTTISQQTIRDCFTQQLYALELDPPPDGVTVERELTLKVP